MTLKAKQAVVSGAGFILTRGRREVLGNIYLEYWLSTDKGPVLLVTEPQKDLFFILSELSDTAKQHLIKNGIEFESKPLRLKTFNHQPVSALYFKKSGLAFRARNTLAELGIQCFEADIRLTERYLMERFIYGAAQFFGHTTTQAKHKLVNTQLKPAQYQPNLKVVSLDIECSPRSELYSIGLASTTSQCVLMIGAPQPGAPEWITWVKDEPHLLKQLIREINRLDPDIIIGWNVINFDLKLLIQRANLHRLSLSLGRDNQHITWRKKADDNSQGFITLAGRLVIDGIDALKTATYQFDSFSLEFVAQALLNKGKKTADVDNRLEAITRDFLNNKIALAEYNLQDCQLVLEIFSHTKLLNFLILRSQLTGLELDRMGGSVAAFINLYLPKLHRAGYIAPNRPENGGLASPGGYVMESRPGLYNNVLVLDFKSLYPSIIRTFKIDPLGLTEGLLQPARGIEGFKGAVFSRTKHFLPHIITSLSLQRDAAKKSNDVARSQAIKILMNSFYGVLGSGGCPFYDTRLASSITLRGHEIMQTTAKWILEMGYQVIYGDTDSLFIWLENPCRDEQANNIGNDLKDAINQRWSDSIQTRFQLESHLEIEFETHFTQFFMPTIRGSKLGSKKRYAGLIGSGMDSQLIFKGLETVRSDWSPLAKQFQQKLFSMIFAKQDVRQYVKGVIADTYSGKLDNQLHYRKRLRRRLSHYIKNIPPHVKAARLADFNNKKHGKSLRYQSKGWITYVITVNGPEPVEYLKHPIDYDHYVEKQLRPVAEGILPLVGLSFSKIAQSQLQLF